MLRFGPNGVQKVVGKSQKPSGGVGASGGGGLKAAAAGAGAPAVLSFKTVASSGGAKLPAAQAPLTPAAPRAKPAPPRREVKQELKEAVAEEGQEGDGQWGEAEVLHDEDEDLNAGDAWKAEAQQSAPRPAKVGPGTLLPTAKRPPPSKPAQASAAPAKAPPPKAALKRGALSEPQEEVLENDAWVKQFERKWQEAMGRVGSGGGERAADEPAMAPQDGGPPPAKRPRPAPERAPPTPTARTPAVPSTARAAAGPKPPSGPPPRRPVAPATPKGPSAAGAVAGPPSESELKLRAEQPEWAARCTIEAAKPGQPQRLTLSMAEFGLGDEGIAEWCRWMERRLAVARPGAAGGGGRARFRAGTIDFSENELSVVGLKALCATLEKFGVRAEVLRLTGNNIGNEGVRCIAKFLTSSSQASAQELYLSRNKVTPEGVKWLLAALAAHPAYPVWNNETERFVPLWLRLDNNKIKPGVGYEALQAASAFCSVCLGERSAWQAMSAASEDIKHNCVAHLVGWAAPEGAEPLPAPAPHARSIFAAPGRGAARPPPSGIEDPVREEPRIVYEDDDLAVVLKPAGWSCLPQPKGVDPSWAQLKPLARRKQVGELLLQTATTPPLQAWLLLHFGADPNCDASRDQTSDRGLAHRLDLDTSGPILVGKTLKGYEHARKQVLAGLLKDYIALVHGAMPTERGEVVAPIDASAYAQLKRVTVAPGGQPATTVWEAIAEYEDPDRKDERYTLVQCRVGTLRTHQIRAHLEHLGHPVVGDRVYCGDVGAEPPAFCPRIFLHESRLGFFNAKGQTCIESCSLQTVSDLWNTLGCLRKVGGMAARGCGAPGL